MIARANNHVAPWSGMNYRLYLNKSNIYRFERNHDAAISELSTALQKVSDTTDIKYLNRWICVNEQEKANRVDSVFSDSSFDVFDYCYNVVCPGNPDVLGTGNGTEPRNILGNTVNFKEIEIVIYPNPTQNGLWVESVGKIKASQIKVYNAQGSRMSVEAMQRNGMLFIPTKDLSSGVYTLQIENRSKNTAKHKFVVLK